MASILKTRYATLIAAALGFAVAGSGPACSAEVTLHVAPDGNDAWSGSLARPNAQKTDGPLASPTKARDAIRSARSKDPGQGVTVLFAGGTYVLSEPLELGPQDSGTATAPVVWAAEGHQSPVFSAGRRITGWEKMNVNGHAAWKAVLPPQGPEFFFFRALWINGAPATRARWPKTGTLAVAPTAKLKTYLEWRHPESEFPFIAGDLPEWPSAADGEAIVTSRWVESRLPISDIDQKTHILHASKMATFHPETADRYYLENIKQCLTEPGEWYLDPREHAVYLIAPAGIASPNDAEVIAPVLPQVMRLAGDMKAGKWIEHITFRGITFAHSQWYFDHVAPGEKATPALTSYHQAEVGIPGAVWGEGVRNCMFDHCTIAHVGSYAVELGRGCQGNRIVHCTIADTGAGGIKIGSTSPHDSATDQAFANEISDCRITDGGNLFPSAVGVWIGQSHDNTLSHNEIARFWYSGISVGWTWGYGKALSQNNQVEYNDVHHIGIKHDQDKPILSDMGGIYTLGNQKGTRIDHNRFHDIAALKYGGWGIYFDEGTTDILAEDNVVYRTSHAGFHQHYGRDNIVRNNIFAFGRDFQIRRTRIEDHLSFTFEDNIVYWKTGALLNGRWEKLNCVFDHNTYWRVGGEAAGPILFGKLTWDQWRAAGMDKDSKIADPHFANAEAADFRLHGDSASALAGFVPFELSGVGPRQ